MTYDTPEWQAAVKRMRSTLKARMTKAKKQNTRDAWLKVIEQTGKMRSYFDATSYPDWWSIIDRYEGDAELALRFLPVGWSR